MSIEVNWRTATSGPDGEALAEQIRSFIHDKFQQVALPRFIRSVQVHSFDFGTIPPDLEIKDFCEPFADFYEEDGDDEDSELSEELVSEQGTPYSDLNESPFRDEMTMNHPLRDPFTADGYLSPLRSPIPLGEHLNAHFPRSGTPGIPGGTSTLGYHLMALGGLSGTQTPLAAVAGGTSFANGWSDPGNRARLDRSPHASMQHQPHRPEADIDTGTVSRPSTANSPPSHRSIGHSNSGSNQSRSISEEEVNLDPSTMGQRPPRMRERKPEDFQVLCHAKYAGDIRLSLTAEILLDYPMPSFVGLPLKLNVTGVTFDGVAVLAYIRKRVHFSFLSPDDADALIGSEQQADEGGDGRPRSGGDASTSQKRHGGLLQEIRVESEIGRKEDGKQVLKNVGKVERFVLAQVRRIFEEELVFPSHWTFLI